MDRSSDPSPFAWIFAGALALVGLGAALSASRRSRRARREQVWAAPDRTPRASGPAEADDVLGAHPS
jgi:hypothetical protein